MGYIDEEDFKEFLAKNGFTYQELHDKNGYPVMSIYKGKEHIKDYVVHEAEMMMW